MQKVRARPRCPMTSRPFTEFGRCFSPSYCICVFILETLDIAISMDEAEGTLSLDNQFNTYNDSSRSSPTTINHSRQCKHKKDNSLEDLISDVVDKNPRLISASFYKRGNINGLCSVTSFRYEISLTSNTIKCFGCKRNVRSSFHVCKTYDLFDKNQWLGKHQNGIFRTIRCRNFKTFAKMLGYKLPYHIIAGCNLQGPQCQSVVFLDIL